MDLRLQTAEQGDQAELDENGGLGGYDPGDGRVPVEDDIGCMGRV